MDITAGKLFGTIGQPQPALVGASLRCPEVARSAWKFTHNWLERKNIRSGS